MHRYVDTQARGACSTRTRTKAGCAHKAAACGVHSAHHAQSGRARRRSRGAGTRWTDSGARRGLAGVRVRDGARLGPGRRLRQLRNPREEGPPRPAPRPPPARRRRLVQTRGAAHRSGRCQCAARPRPAQRPEPWCPPGHMSRLRLPVTCPRLARTLAPPGHVSASRPHPCADPVSRLFPCRVSPCRVPACHVLPCHVPLVTYPQVEGLQRRGRYAKVALMRLLQARHIPARHVPVRQVPARHVPIRHVPIRHVPVRHVPVRHVPARHVPARHVSPSMPKMTRLAAWLVSLWWTGDDESRCRNMTAILVITFSPPLWWTRPRADARRPLEPRRAARRGAALRHPAEPEGRRRLPPLGAVTSGTMESDEWRSNTRRRGTMTPPERPPERPPE
jgi:hypothetical protein